MNQSKRDSIVPVRFNLRELDMLDFIAQDYSLKRSEVIRMLIRGEHKILKQLKK